MKITFWNLIKSHIPYLIDNNELPAIAYDKLFDLCVYNNNLVLELQVRRFYKYSKSFDEQAFINSVQHIPNLTCLRRGRVNLVHYQLDNNRFIKELINDIISSTIACDNLYHGHHSLKGKKIIVEYSSPNMAKKFHAGHLRSTILGHFLSNLFTFLGADVIKMNYPGDWGTQYGLLGYGYQIFGDPDKLESNPVDHLVEIYVKMNQEIKKAPEKHKQYIDEYVVAMRNGDNDKLRLWKRFRDLSFNEYNKIYKRLGVTFDVIQGESEVRHKHSEIIKLLDHAEILSIDMYKRKYVDLNEYGLGILIVEKSNGGSLYVTRDLATAIGRYQKYSFDNMYYVVAIEQKTYFQQLFKVLELLGFKWVSNCEHIDFGLVKGMSTRKGTSVFLEDILDKANNIMHSQMIESAKSKINEIDNPLEISDKLARSAITIQDFRGFRRKNYEFDWSRMLSFRGKTGPYINFAYARISAIIEKNKDVILRLDGDIHYELLIEKEILDLFIHVSKFSQIIDSTYEQKSPHLLCNYTLDLAEHIARIHGNILVIDQEQNLAEARLLVYYCVQKVLGLCMHLMGLALIDRM